MTREEEIQAKFREVDRAYHYDALAPACIDMAHWADSTMLSRASAWLASEYPEVDLARFKKAMTE